MKEYIIPNALQIVIDDLGWFNGKDDRENHGPSCTAMPRNHVAEDYLAVNELGRALGTPVVNFNLQKSFDNNILKALITGYMKRGGAQLQITCTSREDMLDAYEHPENYGNLVVRVGGYSEYFTRLSRELQKMVINRTIQSEI